MTRRSWKDRMDPAEAADADLRKSTFREMANVFIFDLKHGMITDRPGSIAGMMEQAFKAGALAAQADSTFDSKDKLKRPLTDLDVPSLARDALGWIRYALGGGFTLENFHEPVETLNIGSTGKPFRPEALALFMRPKIPGFPSTMSKDEWFIWMVHDKHTFSNKVVGPLEKAGLLNVTNLNEQGWRVALVNEWGFELLVTGRTSFPEDRQPGLLRPLPPTASSSSVTRARWNWPLRRWGYWARTRTTHRHRVAEGESEMTEGTTSAPGGQIRTRR